MKTTAERLRWALALAHRDLTGLSTEGLEQLRDELRHFLGTRVGTHWPPIPLRPGTTRPLGDIQVTPVPTQEPLPLTFSVEDFAHLQTAIKETLLGIADWPFVDGTTQPQPLQVTFLLNLLLSRQTGRYTLNVLGTVHELTLYVLFHLIAQVPVETFRRCPECHSVFVRVRRQLHCSMRCSKRANTRAWRHTPQGQKYLQAQARKRAAANAKKRYLQSRRQRATKRPIALPVESSETSADRE